MKYRQSLLRHTKNLVKHMKTQNRKNEQKKPKERNEKSNQRRSNETHSKWSSTGMMQMNVMKSMYKKTTAIRRIDEMRVEREKTVQEITTNTTSINYFDSVFQTSPG